MNEPFESEISGELGQVSVSSLIETDIRTTRHESEFLKEMLTSYYRQSLAYPLEFYKNIAAQPVDVRMELRSDPFRKKAGPYVHVLDFSETERIKFAHEAECNELVVFLLFERDLEVLEAVFNNPRLPTKNLLDFIHLIKERDIDREDDKILKLAQTILKRRTQRIVKARDIQVNSQEPIDQGKLITIFTYLWDDDPLIRQAGGNVLSIVDWRALHELLQQPDLVTKIRERAPKIPGSEIFPLMELMIRLLLKIHKTAVMLGQTEEKQYDLIYESLCGSLKQCKTNQLLLCKEDPTDEFHLSLLAWYHVDTDTGLSKLAAEALSLEDLFELLSDSSTPRRVVLPILATLEKHPEQGIVNRISEVRISLAERDNKKLKEIEVSVNAYFDVIFQSLGYVRINDRKDAVQVLKSSLTFIHQYHVESGHADIIQLGNTDQFLNEAINHFQNSIQKMYTDTKKELFSEMQQIHSMIEHVLDLKSFKFDDDQTPGDVQPDAELMNKAATIWRISISRYLGRIKDLDEMLHMKLIKFMQEMNPSDKPEQLEDELHIASMEIETVHKESVDCMLKIPCRECKRRGCASERFLLQCGFLLDEMISRSSKSK